MKNLKILIKKPLVIILMVTLVATSCDQWIDHDINENPDAPGNVPVNLLLPAVQQSMGYNLLGNDAVRTNGIWMQQFDGVDRQSFTTGRYQLNPGDVDNFWTGIYSEMLINSSIIIDQAADSPHYAGVARVLTATTLGISTDLFGDMPYSEALNGANAVLTPAYDTQEEIYTSIFSLLDQAVVDLNSANNALDLSGDVCYNGDTSKWIKAAYAINARYQLQLSEINGDAAYTAALAAVSNAFTSNADDFEVPFDSDDKNPIHQFMEQRTDIRMGSTFVDMLTATDDPRLPFYVAEDGDGNYTGSEIGSQNINASWPGSYVAAQDAPVYLMTYAELKFIEAECRLMLGQSGAQEAYEEAVAASISRVTGSTNQAWLDANIVGDPVTLEKVMMQKYINSFGTNQAYADYRRTGFPDLTLAPGAVLGQIPLRFPYGQSEWDYNTDNLPSTTLTDPVWWDN